jgi:hypothetical protein
MCFSLRHYKESGSNSVNATIYALGRDEEAFHQLTCAQRAAIRGFLKHMAFNAPRYSDDKWAKRALRDIWLKPEMCRRDRKKGGRNLT